jgi:hypothetical protein
MVKKKMSDFECNRMLKYNINSKLSETMSLETDKVQKISELVARRTTK